MPDTVSNAASSPPPVVPATSPEDVQTWRRRIMDLQTDASREVRPSRKMELYQEISGMLYSFFAGQREKILESELTKFDADVKAMKRLRKRIFGHVAPVAPVAEVTIHDSDGSGMKRYTIEFGFGQPSITIDAENYGDAMQRATDQFEKERSVRALPKIVQDETEMLMFWQKWGLWGIDQPVRRTAARFSSTDLTSSHRAISKETESRFARSGEPKSDEPDDGVDYSSPSDANP